MCLSPSSHAHQGCWYHPLLRPKEISISIRACQKSGTEVWLQPSPGKGNSTGLPSGDAFMCICESVDSVCVCVVCTGSHLWVLGWGRQLRLDERAGGTSFCRLGHWLCHSTCPLSERLLQRRDLIIILESEVSCALLLATSGCLSYVSHGNTAQQPRRRCQEQPTV